MGIQHRLILGGLLLIPALILALPSAPDEAAEPDPTPAPTQEDEAGAIGAGRDGTRPLLETSDDVRALGLARTSFLPEGWDRRERDLDRERPTLRERRQERTFGEGARRRLGNVTVFSAEDGR